MNKWTRKRILQAFDELVTELGYENVSLVMIQKRAEVGKTTFYRYFKDKADLMDAHYREIYDSAFEDENCTTFQDLFTLILKRTKNRPEELAMFDTIGYDSYRDFIYKYTFARGKEIVEKAWGRKLDKKEEMKVAMFCGGGARIMEEWAMGKYRNMSAEEAGEIIAHSVSSRWNVPLHKEKTGQK